MFYSPFGAESTVGTSRFRFNSKELDQETGLYYYGGRYYDPAQRTFITPDPYGVRPYDPQTLNRYAYVRNNPVRFIDPTGYETCIPGVGCTYPEDEWTPEVIDVSRPGVPPISVWDILDPGYADMHLEMLEEQYQRFLLSDFPAAQPTYGLSPGQAAAEASTGVDIEPPGVFGRRPPPRDPSSECKCFAQLKYRPTDKEDSQGMTHALWYAQDRHGQQRVVTGGPDQGYLKVWVIPPPASEMSAAVWFSSGLSSANCDSIDRLLAAGNGFPENGVPYFWKGPNSNTVARVVGDAGGFRPPMPPRAWGWDYQLTW